VKSLYVALVMAAAAVPASAQTQSIAGTWDAGYNTPGGARTFQLILKVTGDSVSGTVKRATGEIPLTGTIKGDAVTFRYSVPYNDNALTLTITATVTGDAMKGTVDFAGAGSDEFWAKRAAAPPPDERRARSRQ
jgi:hypothetical protein